MCLVRSARDLLSRMLVVDPTQRISTDDALEHPYLRMQRPKLDLSVPPIPRYLETDDDNTEVEYWKGE